MLQFPLSMIETTLAAGDVATIRGIEEGTKSYKTGILECRWKTYVPIHQ
jgi:hypothetical protein